MAASDLVKLAQAVIVTSELMGYELPARAAEGMARELQHYDPRAVATALKRCQRELTGRLSLAAIIQRIDDGHPSPEAAWAICQSARDEADTVVWTDEINAAWSVCEPLLKQGDQVAGRMAFLEAYRAGLQISRDEHKPARWWPSLGHDVPKRVTAVLDATERGRLTVDHARVLVGGHPEAERRLRALGGGGETPPTLPAAPGAIDALVATATPRRLH